MKAIARFSTWTEATDACDILKSRGISAVAWPDEAPTSAMWHHGATPSQVGYRLDVEADRAADACLQLKRLGFVVFDDDAEA